MWIFQWLSETKQMDYNETIWMLLLLDRRCCSFEANDRLNHFEKWWLTIIAKYIWFHWAHSIVQASHYVESRRSASYLSQPWTIGIVIVFFFSLTRLVEHILIGNRIKSNNFDGYWKFHRDYDLGCRCRPDRLPKYEALHIAQCAL